MTDIHSHILHGLDDGARSFEDSVAMVHMALAAGTTDIVASPHANEEYAFDPNTVERKIRELQDAVGDSPRIHFGCDFHLTVENLEDAVHSPGKYSINHRRYLLVEFSDFHIPKTTVEIFDRLLRAGLRPIVTHPERNRLLRNKLDELENWVSQGALVQVTAQSLLGGFGSSAKVFAHELMDCGLAHFLASDAHDLKHRTSALDEPRRYVEKKFGGEMAARVFEENPRAVLAGVALPARALMRKKRWFSFC